MAVPLDQSALQDGELARRIHGTSEGAARQEEAELCARFSRRIRLYGLRHLHDEASAADLVQRVLEITLQKLRGAQVREPERIASFVLGTARTVCRDMIRSGARTAALAEDGAETAAPPVEPQAMQDHLARCLEALSERERTVVVLTFYREETALEIADALGASEGNVRVIRHRAIRRLRDCMGVAGGNAS